MAQAVSRWSLIVKAQVRQQDNPFEICDEQSGTETGFPPSTYSFPVSLIPPMVHTQLHLQVSLNRRTNGRILGKLLKGNAFLEIGEH